MSRLGKKPIKLNNVTFKQVDSGLEFSGPKGTLVVPQIKGIKVKQKEDELILTPIKNNGFYSPYWGLQWSLINNAIKGVTEGFEKRLTLIGVGFRANVQGKTLVINAGYSHPVNFEIPEGVEITVEENTTIVVRGFDKQLVGQVAANIRKIRKPEPYKGKGIRYEDEYVRRKAGKSGKAEA